MIEPTRTNVYPEGSTLAYHADSPTFHYGDPEQAASRYMRGAYQYGTREKVIIGGPEAVAQLTPHIPIGAPSTVIVVAKDLGARAYVIERELYSAIKGASL